MTNQIISLVSDEYFYNHLVNTSTINPFVSEDITTQIVNGTNL